MSKSDEREATDPNSDSKQDINFIHIIPEAKSDTSGVVIFLS